MKLLIHFINFSGWEWISEFTPHVTMNVITCPRWFIHVRKKGSLYILCGAFRFRLQFRYGANWASTHPVDFIGDLTEIVLDEDEVLTNIAARSGVVIINIQFATNKRSFPLLGSTGSNPDVFISANELVYFTGSQSDSNSLGLRVSRLAAMALTCSTNWTGRWGRHQMETISALLTLCAVGRWIPLTKTSDAELWCFLWSALWINGWVNNREVGDLRRYGAHWDAMVPIMTSL